MSIQNAAGQTYSGAQVSVGGIQDGGAVTLFTETASNNPDTLSIGAVSGDTVQFSYTANGTTVSGFGTLIANTANAFLFSYINGTSVTNFYVSNANQTDLPGINVAALPNESAAPVYVAPCYCPGTLIRTENGDVPVEQLAIGDRVVTVSGDVKPVRWIGTRSYAGRFFASNPDLRPVRFRTGSLGTDGTGQSVPSRDLLVSPKHAMLIDGVLVPAALLVNNRTVVREAPAREVTYIHVELPEHDAIWAENAASETFVDDGSRNIFQNAATFAALYPDAQPTPAVFCAPRVEAGEQLEAIRRRLDTLTGPDAIAA